MIKTTVFYVACLAPFVFMSISMNERVISPWCMIIYPLGICYYARETRGEDEKSWLGLGFLLWAFVSPVFVPLFEEEPNLQALYFVSCLLLGAIMALFSWDRKKAREKS